MKPNKIDYSKAIDGFIELNKLGEVMEEKKINICNFCTFKGDKSCEKPFNDTFCIKQQLQLKDKMIELMLKDTIKGYAPYEIEARQALAELEQK